MKSNTRKPIVMGEPLPNQDLAKLEKKRARRNAETRKQDLTWPDPNGLDFGGITEELAKGVFPVHPGIVAMEARYTSRGGRNRGGHREWKGERIAKIRGKGNPQGKPQGKSRSTGKQWPDPDAVHAEVERLVSGMKDADEEGNVVIGGLNCLFGNASKFLYFAKAFKEVVSKIHVEHLSEVSVDGVDVAAKQIGYQGFCSVENSRGQAVGFLVNPRMEVVAGPIEYQSFAQIQSIRDLRPAYRIDVCDRSQQDKNKKKRRVIHIVVHPKSMMGGPKVTAAVRRLQFQALATELLPEIEKMARGDEDAAAGIVICGDLNFIVNKGYDDADPLYKVGFQLIAKDDTRATQIYSADSRIDAFFVLGLDEGVDFYDVVQFFKTLGRSFTDHAQIAAQWLVASQDDTSMKGG